MIPPAGNLNAVVAKGFHLSAKGIKGQIRPLPRKYGNRSCHKHPPNYIPIPETGWLQGIPGLNSPLQTAAFPRDQQLCPEAPHASGLLGIKPFAMNKICQIKKYDGIIPE
jgi:hypothetical protein